MTQSTASPHHQRHCKSANLQGATLVIGSDIGQQRSVQQDAYHALNTSQTANHGILLVVADGMGGEQGGEIASWMITDTFASQYPQERRQGTPAYQAMEACILASNARILQEAKASGRTGMGSTVVAVAIEDSYARLAHVGDSRAYRVDDEGMQQLTTDHSRVQRLIKEGILSVHEAETHPDAHILSQAVGRENIQVDFSGGAPLAIHNTLLMLCSDGLTGMLADGVIEAALRAFPPQKAFDELMDLANALDASDNITIAIFSARQVESSFVPIFLRQKEELLRLHSSKKTLPSASPQTQNNAWKTSFFRQRKFVIIALLLAFVTLVLFKLSTPRPLDLPLPAPPENESPHVEVDHDVPQREKKRTNESNSQDGSSREDASRENTASPNDDADIKLPQGTPPPPTSLPTSESKTPKVAPDTPPQEINSEQRSPTIEAPEP